MTRNLFAWGWQGFLNEWKLALSLCMLMFWMGCVTLSAWKAIRRVRIQRNLRMKENRQPLTLWGTHLVVECHHLFVHFHAFYKRQFWHVRDPGLKCFCPVQRIVAVVEVGLQGTGSMWSVSWNWVCDCQVILPQGRLIHCPRTCTCQAFL